MASFHCMMVVARNAACRTRDLNTSRLPSISSGCAKAPPTIQNQAREIQVIQSIASTLLSLVFLQANKKRLIFDPNQADLCVMLNN
jgi:hypothetical protein